MNIGDVLDKYYKEDKLNIRCSVIEKIYTLEIDKYFKKIYQSYYTLEEFLCLYIQLLIRINCKDCDDEIKGQLFEMQYINIKSKKCKENMHLIPYIHKRIKLDKIDLLRRSHPVIGSYYRYYPKYLQLKEENKTDEEIKKAFGWGDLAYKNFLFAVQAMDVCYLDAFHSSEKSSSDTGLMDFFSSKVFQSKYLEEELEEDDDLKVIYKIIEDELNPKEKDLIFSYIETDSLKWFIDKYNKDFSKYSATEQSQTLLVAVTTKIKREFLKRRGL